jgi:hypothetical protein
MAGEVVGAAIGQDDHAGAKGDTEYGGARQRERLHRLLADLRNVPARRCASAWLRPSTIWCRQAA